MRSPAQAKLALAAGLFLCAALPSDARAQASPYQADVPPPTFNGARPQAGFRTVEALSGEWEVIDFFAVPNREVRLPNGRPWIEHVARRQNGTGRTAGATSWTTSRDCPSLYNTLVWMSVLVAPRIEIAGVSPSEAEPAGRRPITVMADGLSTTAWGRGTQPDHTLDTRVEISSNGGLIAAFGRAASENLKPCWQSGQPAF